ncbi:MAG: homoserine dehydrogenase [Clostridia bacterium]|nr:homoserine dehydrogenase [Clostridia bacterium]
MKVNVAMLGMGNVATGVYKTILQNKDIILHRDNVEFNIVKILVKSLDKERDPAIPSEILTDDINEIINSDSIYLVVELMGNINPTLEYVSALLEKGISVVSANKDMISQHWPHLEACAKEGGSGLYYEASVGGGIPIIKTFLDSLQSNKIKKLCAIINGTTNYILTKMTDDAVPFETALNVAQEKGLAEPDPTSDVEGYDAKYKLSILASLAFHSKIPVSKIYCEGITGILPQDIQYGKNFGYIIKLLAIGKREGNDIEVRVHPAFIPERHPLASVRDAYNAIFIEGDAVGQLMLYGQGAGASPTASAIISDMIVASQTAIHKYTTFENVDVPSSQITFIDNWTCEFYIRLIVTDEPGVLSKVAAIFAKHSISLESVVQKSIGHSEVPIIFITHRAKEKDVKNALSEMKASGAIIDIASLIRVER